MKTTIKPCRVPWSISPTGSLVTLIHTETDICPECCVVLGGARLTTDLRRIEITFEACCFTRSGPKDDNAGVEALGYELDPTTPRIPMGDDFLNRYDALWHTIGHCPDSGFYVATRSTWLESIPPLYRAGCQHYVICGRDGYVELIARGYKWLEREWTRDWTSAYGGPAAMVGKILDEGTGSDS